MNKNLSMSIGIAIGMLAGAAVVVWFSPATGSKLINNLKRGYREALEDAQRASQQRRQELEAQLRQR